MTVSIKINCFYSEEEDLQKLLKTLPKDCNLKIVKRYRDSKERYQLNREKKIAYQKQRYEQNHKRKNAKFYIITSPEGKKSKMSLQEMSDFFGYGTSYMSSKVKKNSKCFGYTIERVL